MPCKYIFWCKFCCMTSLYILYTKYLYIFTYIYTLHMLCIHKNNTKKSLYKCMMYKMCRSEGKRAKMKI